MTSTSTYTIFCIAMFAGYLMIISCSRSEKNNNESTKFRQYYVQGEQLYIKNCSNCHQKDGSGLSLLYPPLNKSDYVDQNFQKVICIMRNGLSGEVIVNGKSFNQPMPAMPALTDLEIAEIATYIYNSWDRNKGLIPVNEVTAIQERCSEN